jgi:L-ribulose-5-phosphate 3-epimerase
VFAVFKLGIISDEISQDFEHALDVTEELGAEYVEIRSLWEKSVVDLSESELKRARQLVEKSGLKVAAIGSSLFKCPLHEGSKASGGGYFAGGRGYADHLATVDHCFELARLFGTQMVRTFAFWREGDLTEDVLGQIVEKISGPVQRAEKQGIVLVLENEHLKALAGFWTKSPQKTWG